MDVLDAIRARHSVRKFDPDHRMREDEIEHGQQALEAGGAVFPEPIKQAMVLLSKVMTKATYKA